MKRFFALGALLLALGASARADDSFTANITAGAIGQDLSNGQYAGTFSVTDNTTHQSFTAFCADTTDEVSFGSTTFNGKLTTGGMPNSIPTGPPQNLNIWGNTPFGTSTGNRMDYLLTQIMVPALAAGLTNAEAAAIQGAIWQIEGNYVVANGVTDPLVLAIDKLVNGQTVSGTGWSLLNNAAAYVSTTTYASSKEILVVPDSSGNSSGNPLQYQVLVGIAVPEPSSMAIAGRGAMGLIGYGWKRRKRS